VRELGGERDRAPFVAIARHEAEVDVVLDTPATTATGDR
jgi:hypothetical protein